MVENPTCFICKHQLMCYFRKMLIENNHFDTISPDYNKNFKLFFETVAKTCRNYEEAEEK